MMLGSKGILSGGISGLQETLYLAVRLGKEVTNLMANDEKKEFTFINEQIKKKPFYKRKWFTQGSAAVALALIFGAAAGVSFAAVRPWAEEQFGRPDEATQIVVVQEESETISEKETERQSERESETEDQTEEETEKISILEYKELYAQMKEVAGEASASLVTVNSYAVGTDWPNETYENMSETSGLIFRVDSGRLYVLTAGDFVKDAQKIVVTFPNGESMEATVRKQDTITELSILEIPTKEIRKETLDSITAISIKGISSVEKGEPVIAVGSPMGYTDSIAFGMITSVTTCQSVDSEYKVITTDIIGSGASYGILLNLDGNIVGIISQNFQPSTAKNKISALSISDMNYLLETLVAGSPISYTGIVGKEVDENTAEYLNMPYGIYVKQVETDSPAMYAGIQVADIITAVNGDQVKTVAEYEDIIRKHREGDVLSVTVCRRSMEGYAEMEMRIIVASR